MIKDQVLIKLCINTKNLFNSIINNNQKKNIKKCMYIMLKIKIKLKTV